MYRSFCIAKPYAVRPFNHFLTVISNNGVKLITSVSIMKYSDCAEDELYERSDHINKLLQNKHWHSAIIQSSQFYSYFTFYGECHRNRYVKFRFDYVGFPFQWSLIFKFRVAWVSRNKDIITNNQEAKCSQSVPVHKISYLIQPPFEQHNYHCRNNNVTPIW